MTHCLTEIDTRMFIYLFIYLLFICSHTNVHLCNEFRIPLWQSYADLYCWKKIECYCAIYICMVTTLCRLQLVNNLQFDTCFLVFLNVVYNYCCIVSLLGSCSTGSIVGQSILIPVLHPDLQMQTRCLLKIGLWIIYSLQSNWLCNL